MRKPKGCLWKRPINDQTVFFNGVAINISEIARLKNIDQGLLSKVFSGKRAPSLKVAKAVSEALGVPIESFLTGIEARVSDQAQKIA